MSKKVKPEKVKTMNPTEDSLNRLKEYRPMYYLVGLRAVEIRVKYVPDFGVFTTKDDVVYPEGAVHQTPEAVFTHAMALTTQHINGLKLQMIDAHMMQEQYKEALDRLVLKK